MLNTPNILSIFRLCLVPVFVVAYFSGLPNARVIAVGIYALATFTDYLDGALARRFHLITNLGKVLDPLGDKMFTFAVLACMSIDKIIPTWVLVIFFVKELLMGLGGIVLHNSAKTEIPPANIIGKTATVLFFMVGVLLLLIDMPREIAMALICLCLCVSVAAFVSYTANFLKIMKDKEKAKE